MTYEVMLKRNGNICNVEIVRGDGDLIQEFKNGEEVAQQITELTHGDKVVLFVRGIITFGIRVALSQRWPAFEVHDDYTVDELM